jgi:hypothetical protein
MEWEEAVPSQEKPEAPEEEKELLNIRVCTHCPSDLDAEQRYQLKVPSPPRKHNVFSSVSVCVLVDM